MYLCIFVRIFLSFSFRDTKIMSDCYFKKIRFSWNVKERFFLSKIVTCLVHINMIFVLIFHSVFEAKKFRIFSQADGKNPYSQESASGPILIQLNQAHTLICCFFKIRFNVALQVIHRSSKFFFHSRFIFQNFFSGRITFQCVLHGIPNSSWMSSL